MVVKKSHNSKDGIIGVVVTLIVLVFIVGGLYYFLLPKSKKELYYFIFIVANGRALFVSALSWTLFFVFLALLFKKKAKFITVAVEEGDKEFSIDKDLTKKQKIIVQLPLLIFIIISIISYSVFYYEFGGQWFYLDFLREKGSASLRLFLNYTNGFQPYILISLYIFILFNAFKIKYRIQKKYFNKDEPQEEFYNKSLPEPENYLSSSMPCFLLGARENKKSIDLEPEVLIPSYIYYRAPMIYGGLLIFGKKGSGKSSIIRRIIYDSLFYMSDILSLKMSICIIDIKGDLADFLEKKAIERNREADVIRLGVSTFAKWNPMGFLNKNSRAHECRQAGFFLRCAMTSGKTSSGNDSYWHDNADNLLFRSMHLLALSDKNVSFTRVSRNLINGTYY